MVSINHAKMRKFEQPDEHLHSTMVSINLASSVFSTAATFIYIPLWYLLISGGQAGDQKGDEIYIPLWYLLIPAPDPELDADKLFTFHYGIY